MTQSPNIDQILSTLLKMRKYFGGEGTWHQRDWGLGSPDAPKAMCIGSAALYFDHGTANMYRSLTLSWLSRYLGTSVGRWNDCESRTLDEVLAMLDDAIEQRSQEIACHA